MVYFLLFIYPLIYPSLNHYVLDPSFVSDILLTGYFYDIFLLWTLDFLSLNRIFLLFL